MDKTQLKRSERLNHILGVVREKGAVSEKSLRAQLSVQLGYSGRLINEYLQTLYDAGELVNTDGVLTLPEMNK